MQLSVKQISKQYAEVLAVDDLSFEVKSGEIFALLGPNGAGKSSTIRMLISLTYPDTGVISFTNIEGQKIAKLVSGDFGYLPEERGLYQESNIQDTLVYMGQLKGMTKADALEQADVWLTSFELAERKRDQLKTLSKGNQQKVQLISAIIHRPKIVFLDEPFSGLDPVNQEKVISFLQLLRKQGTTIILSAHQMSLVEKLADRFLLMNKGKATLYGSIKDIRQAAQLGTHLTVTFSDPVSSESFSLTEQIMLLISIDSHTVQFTLAPSCHVPQFLQSMLAEHQIESLQTEQPSLHDIYINSVKGAA
ncbi:ABC transporter ATP-binding protein [Paraglaciecola sp. MB-3u-78]|uniref:ABC transporter ATP-binding protein n=1 Tax=Paraglaciecola sp. MB-3u-78 TaxID=2058332 RepID=UPI000C34280A|nr:ATP-binding cassette domain-containing protein [Paraglaciecola sp. MB-3u-78]PKG99922.1 ABC transporter ATP-binding protein [Paraglaciecola sp. MB-3u-78]